MVKSRIILNGYYVQQCRQTAIQTYCYNMYYTPTYALHMLSARAVYDISLVLLSYVVCQVLVYVYIHIFNPCDSVMKFLTLICLYLSLQAPFLAASSWQPANTAWRYAFMQKNKN